MTSEGRLVTVLGRRDSLVRVIGLVKDSILPSSRGLALRVTEIVHLNFLRRGTFRTRSAYMPVRGRFGVVRAVLCLCRGYHTLVGHKVPISMLGRKGGVFRGVVSVGCSITGGRLSGFSRCGRSVSAFCSGVVRGGN